jgi:ABC-2 type transport system permease protein
MPLRFFPDWFITLTRFTPFPAMVNTPVEVYLGLLDGGALAGVLLEQLFWLVFLIGAGQLVLGSGVRRLVIQGG